MADAKRYSVSITNGDAIATANASAVYSTGTVYKAYNLVNKVEGDSPSNSPKVATAPSSTGDVTGFKASSAVAATNNSKWKSLAKGKIQASTTSQGDGRGLVISFKTDANGKNTTTVSDYEIVHAGEGYSADEKVAIDGFPGGTIQVTIT